jgi:hypothetical protein
MRGTRAFQGAWRADSKRLCGDGCRAGEQGGRRCSPAAAPRLKHPYRRRWCFSSVAAARQDQVRNNADLTLKEGAIDRTTAPGIRAGRYRAPDNLMAFLVGL